MDDKVSITITTDKPVKIRVTADDDGNVTAGKEAEGLKRLLSEVKGGSNVVSRRETRSGDKK